MNLRGAKFSIRPEGVIVGHMDLSTAIDHLYIFAPVNPSFPELSRIKHDVMIMDLIHLLAVRLINATMKYERDVNKLIIR